ncbi:lysyl oxidase homolog 1-like [Perognathus longimembris pacificus]|uniref:lysyl oxidase homolog 1-like n=1 Tax=Perognathus longimembris pacificus TaxID=214514 RepID=UPI002018F9D1|nr:lysyl oxidase homolog 1-like [Perognathus longimembris pacificus]
MAVRALVCGVCLCAWARRSGAPTPPPKGPPRRPRALAAADPLGRQRAGVQPAQLGRRVTAGRGPPAGAAGRPGPGPGPGPAPQPRRPPPTPGPGPALPGRAGSDTVRGQARHPFGFGQVPDNWREAAVAAADGAGAWRARAPPSPRPRPPPPPPRPFAFLRPAAPPPPPYAPYPRAPPFVGHYEHYDPAARAYERGFVYFRGGGGGGGAGALAAAAAGVVYPGRYDDPGGGEEQPELPRPGPPRAAALGRAGRRPGPPLRAQPLQRRARRRRPRAPGPGRRPRRPRLPPPARAPEPPYLPVRSGPDAADRGRLSVGSVYRPAPNGGRAKGTGPRAAGPDPATSLSSACSQAPVNQKKSQTQRPG